MELKKRIATALATGAVLLNALTPAAFAGTTINISGNGSNSDSAANVSMNQTTTVVQNNTAKISNNVDVDADTGGNDANDNTGGDVKIKTGDADVKAKVENAVNLNEATVDCCQQGDTTVKIEGNGTKSDNDVDLDVDQKTQVYQDNKAYVKNDVDVDADTGDNDAEDNTGGDVKVKTGDAEVGVWLDTKANANFANVGNGDSQNGDLSLKILDNGSNSDNDIDLDLDNEVVVTQDNDAYIYNDVDVDADTGDNDAEDNTGGEVAIKTGDADVKVGVDNMVNFNWADVNCGCLLDDLLAKIDGNGTDSDNDIDVDLDTKNQAFQDNKANLDNDLDDIDADTGNNDAEDNTAREDGDPTVKTGDADVDLRVSNSGNVNSVGGDQSDFPDFDFDFDLNLDLDWSDLLDLLGLLD